jgi:hypothetical protein
LAVMRSSWNCVICQWYRSTVMPISTVKKKPLVSCGLRV